MPSDSGLMEPLEAVATHLSGLNRSVAEVPGYGMFHLDLANLSKLNDCCGKSFSGGIGSWPHCEQTRKQEIKDSRNFQIST